LRRRCETLLLALLSSACEPGLVVGTWKCPPPASDQALGNPSKRLDVPWSTGFETGFWAGGACYSDSDASYSIVDAPVHGGRSAAAFSVASHPSGLQARCFREGALPREAWYGAWFYVPVLAANAGNWNLMHFQGGAPGALHGLWDVSLGSAAGGTLSVYVLNFLGPSPPPAPNAPEVPIAAWFHLEFRLLRARDATGEVALYQDGTLLLERTGLTTDDTDFGQWYVGNFADALTPPDSTLYVDDVTIRAAP
jgi:hypothetical protein